MLFREPSKLFKRELDGAFIVNGYDMLLVLNTSRPFTSTVEGSKELMAQIAASSRLEFTGLIANTHMLEHTTPEIVAEGLKLTEQVASAVKLPIRFVQVDRFHDCGSRGARNLYKLEIVQIGFGLCLVELFQL